MKKKISVSLSVLLLLGSACMSACGGNTGERRHDENVLRVASWDEYIDMGGEDSYYSPDSRPLYEEFEDWYKQTYGKEIKVEYVPLQDNETMYSKIKMGDTYDLLCPSEYMIMKLAAEDKLLAYPESFFDKSVEHNYFIQNVSPYIQEIFQNGKVKNGGSWADYAAGYMWGTTGFVFNPAKIPAKVMTSWNALADARCARKITAKDNVRDAYFVGLGMYYENELLSLRTDYENGAIGKAEYKAALSTKMNDTSVETMGKVKKHLENMRKNLYGLETDEGKLEVISGRLDASFQWSGDAVYILDEAEENGLLLEYSIPKSASNLWFDGWVMMKGANVDAATAFVNFLSRPDNVVRNMSYIGYTSCMAGSVEVDEESNEGNEGVHRIFDYLNETYGDDEGDANYDLSYFFGEGYSLTTTSAQKKRQLFAQYPDMETIDRLVVMEYFDSKTNERANRMWNNIK